MSFNLNAQLLLKLMFYSKHEQREITLYASHPDVLPTVTLYLWNRYIRPMQLMKYFWAKVK